MHRHSKTQKAEASKGLGFFHPLLPKTPLPSPIPILPIPIASILSIKSIHSIKSILPTSPLPPTIPIHPNFQFSILNFQFLTSSLLRPFFDPSSILLRNPHNFHKITTLSKNNQTN